MINVSVFVRYSWSYCIMKETLNPLIVFKITFLKPLFKNQISYWLNHLVTSLIGLLTRSTGYWLDYIKKWPVAAKAFDCLPLCKFDTLRFLSKHAMVNQQRQVWSVHMDQLTKSDRTYLKWTNLEDVSEEKSLKSDNVNKPIICSIWESYREVLWLK